MGGNFKSIKSRRPIPHDRLAKGLRYSFGSAMRRPKITMDEQIAILAEAVECSRGAREAAVRIGHTDQLEFTGRFE